MFIFWLRPLRGLDDRLSNGLEAPATIVNDDAKARARSVRH
jgi:hypothetical protein